MSKEVDKTQIYLIILLLAYIAWLFGDWQRKRVVEVDITTERQGRNHDGKSESRPEPQNLVSFAAASGA